MSMRNGIRAFAVLTDSLLFAREPRFPVLQKPRSMTSTTPFAAAKCPASRSSRLTSGERRRPARVAAHCSRLVTADGAEMREAVQRHAHRHVGEIPDRNPWRSARSCRVHQVHRPDAGVPAAWKRPWVRIEPSQQCRMLVGPTACRPRWQRSQAAFQNIRGQRSGDLQGQVRRGAGHGSAGRRAGTVRRVPPAAGRARRRQPRSTRSTARTLT